LILQACPWLRQPHPSPGSPGRHEEDAMTAKIECNVPTTYNGFKVGDEVVVRQGGSPYADNRKKIGGQVYVIGQVNDRFMVDLFYWDETKTIKYRGGSIDASLLKRA
jgi:hypothetical protein